MFLTPKNSNVRLRGIRLLVNLVSDFFLSILFCFLFFFFFFFWLKKAISSPKCGKMSPLYYSYFILHQPMADVLTDNKNPEQLSDLSKSGSDSASFYKALFLCRGLKVTRCHYFYNSSWGFLLAISISSLKYMLQPKIKSVNICSEITKTQHFH